MTQQRSSSLMCAHIDMKNTKLLKGQSHTQHQNVHVYLLLLTLFSKLFSAARALTLIACLSSYYVRNT